MNKTYDYYFDFGSLASYLAHTQIERIAADTGAQVNLRPMLLGGGACCWSVWWRDPWPAARRPAPRGDFLTWSYQSSP